jgi:prephenate dehydrogenase
LRELGVKVTGAVRSEKSKLVLTNLGFESICTTEAEILNALKTTDILIVGLNLQDAKRALKLTYADGNLLSRLTVFDICSTKSEICSYVADNFPSAKFVGAHPMAGKEKQGPEAAEASLFEGSTVYLTPLAHQPEEVRDTLIRNASEIWHSVGARTASIGPAEHDRIMASVSHGLHLVSCLIARLSGAALNPPPALTPAAGSYRDMTRITQSSGAMWSEIIASNKTNVADWLKALSSECAGLAASIESDQADIEKLFGEAQAARAKIMRT